MGIDLYYTPGSAPCRAVQMTAKAVGVDLNLKLLNLMAGEHLTPEFLKVNNTHSPPYSLRIRTNVIASYTHFSFLPYSLFRSIHNTPSQHWSMKVSHCGNHVPFKLIWSRNTVKPIRCTRNARRSVPSSINVCTLTWAHYTPAWPTTIIRKFSPRHRPIQTT